MIVYTMTEEQIAAEARRDFAEMSGRLRVVYDRFRTDARRYITYSRDNESFNIPRKKTFSIKTRNNNTWNVYFQSLPHIQGITGIVYLAIPFDNGHEYLIIKNFDAYLVERYTRHFIQRYEERHILPHNIKTQGLPLPLHFVLTHYDKNFFRVDKYYGKELNIRENDIRNWFIMGDGMVVVEDKARELKMWTFVTYIDCSDLYDYQQKLLEEERAWDLFEEVKAFNLEEEKNVDVFDRKCAIRRQLIANPDTPYLIEAYLRRTMNTTPKAMKEILDSFWTLWGSFVDFFTLLTDRYEGFIKKVIKEKEKTYSQILSEPIKEPKEGMLKK